jgi:hypothetical protein
VGNKPDPPIVFKIGETDHPQGSLFNLSYNSFIVISTLEIPICVKMDSRDYNINILSINIAIKRTGIKSHPISNHHMEIIIFISE